MLVNTVKIHREIDDFSFPRISVANRGRSYLQSVFFNYQK